MAKGMAAQMLMKKMGKPEEEEPQTEETKGAKPKFGSPAWRAMYDKKGK